jgi:hypothetical protein
MGMIAVARVVVVVVTVIGCGLVVVGEMEVRPQTIRTIQPRREGEAECAVRPCGGMGVRVVFKARIDRHHMQKVAMVLAQVSWVKRLAVPVGKAQR